MSFYAGNYYITEEQSIHNATIVYDYFIDEGWTIEAVCGMLGNMEKESGVNPGIYQYTLDPPNLDLGFGLVQWTPASDYLEWSGGSEDGYKQLERIVYELENGEQYIPTNKHPLTFEEFINSHLPPYELAVAFKYNYERNASDDSIERGRNAEKWYTYFTGEIPPKPIIRGNKRKMPLYMYNSLR